MKSRAFALATLLLGPIGVAGQGQTFRTTTDAVLVGVSVTTGTQPVTDLRREDFSLADNGVEQQIEDVGRVTMPIDLTLLVDTGSEARFLGLLPVIQRDAGLVRSLMRTGDRGSLVTVDSQMRWGAAAEESSSRGEWGSVILDAICAAEMTRTDPGRRHVIVALTAGIDTHSLILPATRDQILARSESPVFVIGGGPILLAGTYVGDRPGAVLDRPVRVAGGGESIYGTAVLMGNYSAPLRAIAEATGGRFLELSQKDSVLRPLREAVDTFRTSYVLRYRPRDVATVGWHALSVKMTRAGRFDVKARRGYWSE